MPVIVDCILLVVHCWLCIGWWVMVYGWYQYCDVIVIVIVNVNDVTVIGGWYCDFDCWMQPSMWRQDKNSGALAKKWVNEKISSVTYDCFATPASFSAIASRSAWSVHRSSDRSRLSSRSEILLVKLVVSRSLWWRGNEHFKTQNRRAGKEGKKIVRRIYLYIIYTFRQPQTLSSQATTKNRPCNQWNQVALNGWSTMDRCGRGSTKIAEMKRWNLK